MSQQLDTAALLLLLEYSVTSTLCYLLDWHNLQNRLRFTTNILMTERNKISVLMQNRLEFIYTFLIIFIIDEQRPLQV